MEFYKGDRLLVHTEDIVLIRNMPILKNPTGAVVVNVRGEWIHIRLEDTYQYYAFRPGGLIEVLERTPAIFVEAPVTLAPLTDWMERTLPLPNRQTH